MREHFNSSKSFAIFVVFSLLMALSNPVGNSMMTDEQRTAFLKASAAEIAKTTKEVDPKQLNCLAKNIFWEANGEPLHGQAAVARVVMNRISYGFGKNPCSVIYQSNVVPWPNQDGEIQNVKVCQFSWVCENKGEPNKNNPRYKLAERIAYEVLAHNAYVDLIPKSTLFFHSVFIPNPNWPYYRVTQIGNHIFYSKGKPKQNVSNTNEKKI